MSIGTYKEQQIYKMCEGYQCNYRVLEVWGQCKFMESCVLLIQSSVGFDRARNDPQKVNSNYKCEGDLNEQCKNYLL